MGNAFHNGNKEEHFKVDVSVQHFENYWLFAKLLVYYIPLLQQP